MTNAPEARVATIDGLRGIAVMGILLMNIASFALPSGAYFNPLGAGSAPGHADLAVWAADFVLVDGKMRALFSILFGASLLIVVRSAEARGESGFGRHMARMATLALFGAVHLFLIWPGDILLHYAIVGVFAFPFAGIEPRQQIKAALMLLVLQFVVGALFFTAFLSLYAHAHAPGADAATLAGWRDFAAGVGSGRSADIAADVALHRGPWLGLVAHNLVAERGATGFLLIFDGPETLAYMLIGMAALGSGFLSGRWPRRRYRRWAAIGLAISVPPSIALASLCFASGFDTLTTFTAATLGGIAFRPIMALADAALFILWLTAGSSALRDRVIAAGRCAFTNYLGASILMTALFDGWGFGLFGKVDRVDLLWFAGITCLLMLAWSKPWLARFRYGPLEWAWRSLARGKPQPQKYGAQK